MSFGQGGWSTSFQNGWLIGQKPVGWQKLQFIFWFYILEREKKNVSLPIFKIKDGEHYWMNKKPNDPNCCQLKGTHTCGKSALAQILGINLTLSISLLIELLLNTWVVFSLNMIETRVRHNFASSSTATYCLKKKSHAYLFDAKVKFSDICFFLPFPS